MVATKRKDKKPASLSAGRSRHLVTHKPKSSLSAKATASIIRGHHQLQNAHAQAVKAGDHVRAAQISRKIEQQGGLKKYQEASITGQNPERGGDSSRVLIDWLESLDLSLRQSNSAKENNTTVRGEQYRLLEVGALSTTNACSKQRYLAVERIDLNSQGRGILKQDFMQRPLPRSDKERFDVISLSLVLNYVPDGVGRGEMLKRTCAFLLDPTRGETKEEAEEKTPFPCLFLVLPASCVTNSRYLNQQLLEQIMNNLGYALLKEKVTSKLLYQLWKFKGEKAAKKQQFSKTEINPGAQRNNFRVLLQ